MPQSPSTDPAACISRRARAVGVQIGRRGYVASVGAALLGFGLAGVSAATADRPDPAGHAAIPTAAPADRADTGAAQALAQTAAAQARADAARRADRSGRSAATPVAPGASASRTASPSRTTRKPSPEPKPIWVDPMPGAAITSCYGYRWGALHAGVDLAQPENTPIRAAGAGTVVAAGWIRSGYGISVLIDHGDGYLTHYGHQNRRVVQAGEKVVAGEIIGYEGSTGDSTGPHLHFEVHRGEWNQIDPAPWMRERGVDLGC